MPNISYLAVALLGALHTATYGAYKDSPYEGFRWDSFVRELAFAALHFPSFLFFMIFHSSIGVFCFLLFPFLQK